MNRAFWTCMDFPEASWMDNASGFSEKIMDNLGLDSWDLSICFCSKAYMEQLNHDFRNKAGPTDVLSFKSGEWLEMKNDNRYIAGDVILCPDIILENAQDFGISGNEELKRVITHGVLHLYGMDHISNDTNEPMLIMQERLLNEFIEEIILL